MQVGDLVRGRLSLGGRIGIVLKAFTFDVRDDTYLLVQWKGGVLDTLNERLLEVVNESR